ncbi:DUF4158 domain-containing protein [Aeromonas veronii]|uniref:DUF4158 domain-containing protein n=1 Tax=Aeromonas veronii TaxID=654 RepID=UPI004055611F
MQASDTAYPRLKSSFNAGELARWYTPTPEELAYCAQLLRGKTTRLGFLLSLKTFQRLGYFVTSDQIPAAIIDHLANTEKLIADRYVLARYDVSRSRKSHMGLIRRFLGVLPFDDEADVPSLFQCRVDQGRLGRHHQRRH